MWMKVETTKWQKRSHGHFLFVKWGNYKAPIM